MMWKITITASSLLAVIFAEADGIPSWVAPWTTTGLAGLILFWLFFYHLPAKDKQMETLITAKDAILVAMITSRDAMMKDFVAVSTANDKERREDYKRSLDAVVTHCERESDRRDEMLRSQLGESARAITDLRETMEQLREMYLRERAGR